MNLQTLRMYPGDEPALPATTQQAEPPINPAEQPTFPELMAGIVEEGNQVVRDLRDQASSGDLVGSSGDLDDDSGDLPWDDPNAPIADMSEELYWAEVRLAGSMADVERERIELEATIQKQKEAVQQADGVLKRCEAELYESKESHKSATDRLLALARKLVEITKDKKLPTEEELTQLEAKQDDGWRHKPTVELLSEAKLAGLSKKKIELLAEHAPTLGHLEDLRGLASKECVPYHKKLPKGIGGSVADAIEIAQENYLREWTAKQADPARVKLADDLLAECVSTVAEWQAADCVPKGSDGEHLHAGYTAFREGHPHTAFLSDDHKQAKQWILGWAMAKRMKLLADHEVV
jgi:hypothetical protein